jgi:acetyl esterase/lipase
MDMTIEQISQMLRAAPGPGSADLSVEDRRAAMVAGTQAMRPKESVTIESTALGGIPGLHLSPAEPIKDRALLYLHGGGYVIGSPETHKGFVSYLADAMQADTWLIDYRMGPEAPFPAAVDDALSAYKALLETHTAENIIIAGDSAGGGLTLAVAMKIRDVGLALPAGLVALSPWANLNQIGSSYDTKADTDPMVSRDGLNWFAAHYLGPNGDADDPYASPAYGDFSGLPPLLIQVGADEALLSDSIAVADRAGSAHVAITLEIWPNMIHVFQSFYPFLQDSRDAIARIGAWATSRVKI